MTTTTFATSPLITAGAIADGKPPNVFPEGMMLLDHRTPLENATLCELNRFAPDAPYRWVPLDDAERDAALADVEKRGRQWEATTGKLLPIAAGFAVPSYVKNLQLLLLCVDIERGETLARMKAEEASGTRRRQRWPVWRQRSQPAPGSV